MTNGSERRLKKTDLIILGCILIIAFVLRMYRVSAPVADFHSWRQSDTAAVSRNFVRSGFDLMHPKYDDLSNIQSGKENPQGYRFVEFPIYNALISLGNVVFPVLSIDIWGRLISIFSSLVIIWLIYYFLFKEHSRTAAIFGAVTFAVFPFFIFFSRVILPEMNALAFALLSIFFFYNYIHVANKKVLNFILSLLCYAVAILIKPTAIFYAIPIIYLFLVTYRVSVVKQLPFYLFALSIIPLALWRKYILNFPEGIPASDWLITSVNTSTGLQVIFLRPAFFRWVFYERINNLILGGYTTFLFLVGLIVRSSRYFLHSIIVASAVYLFVFEGGNVQHAYYQVFILPALAIAVGMGAAFLIENSSKFISKAGVYLLIIGCMGFSIFISYTQVKDYYHISQTWVDAAKVIDAHTKLTDKVITDTVGDTTLLYLSDRRGAPAVFVSLPELKQKGYSYFITFSSDVAKAVEKETKFEVVATNDQFTLFKL